ncbi:uncharacterized protein LOC126665426 [Mercurialis annua]|uniref:uncharacterized protein LOC126665426 n=1 Tax=Mercurialis annua TaxID=3986 RepID=UPI00215F5767|nr:uncharacterized protein LOC126665426 [Mercurialis annua]
MSDADSEGINSVKADDGAGILDGEEGGGEATAEAQDIGYGNGDGDVSGNSNGNGGAGDNFGVRVIQICIERWRTVANAFWRGMWYEDFLEDLAFMILVYYYQDDQQCPFDHNLRGIELLCQIADGMVHIGLFLYVWSVVLFLLIHLCAQL